MVLRILVYSFRKLMILALVRYTDAGYLSDPHNARSQTDFVFLHGGTAISWKSSKQTLVATSTNHYEIIALFEASHECVWLRKMINHIEKSCGIDSQNHLPLSMKIMMLVLHKCKKKLHQKQYRQTYCS